MALVGRVVFMLSWSVVSSMFPVSASHTQRQGGRSVLYTALLLVGNGYFRIHRGGGAGAGGRVDHAAGEAVPAGHDSSSFSALLTEYAVMTGIYCIAVVVMMYEISRRTGTAAWVQLGASVLLAGAIWRYHDSLSQVILVQMFVMCGLLVGRHDPALPRARRIRACSGSFGTFAAPAARAGGGDRRGILAG